MNILKHYESIGGKIPRAVAISICRGEARLLDLRGANPVVGMKALELLFDRLGGVQFRNYCLVGHAMRAPNPEAKNHTDLAYDFIDKNCPFHEPKLEQIKWMAREIENDSSPIYGWFKPDVREGDGSYSGWLQLCHYREILPDHTDGSSDGDQGVAETLDPHLQISLSRPGWPPRLGKDAITVLSQLCPFVLLYPSLRLRHEDKHSGVPVRRVH